MQTSFIIATHGPGLYDCTRQVARWLPAADGLLTLMIRHTSASLLIMENADPQVPADLTAWLHRLVPPATDASMAYLTHTAEGPDDMPAHLKAALLPVSLSIPVARGKMRLGTWQGIFVVEHRTRPHQRELAAHFHADAPA